MTTPPRNHHYTYGLPNQNRPTALTKDEAMENILAGIIREHFPPNIKVTTYRDPTIQAADLNPLEFLLELLDENYGDPDDPAPTHPTPEMVQAERTFITAVLSHYRPWPKVPLLTETINVPAWMDLHPNKFPDTPH